MLTPVFDIKDCGPRNRFVANGKLVHNCESINLQNLRRGSELRKSLLAPEGKLIYVADSSNIEARMLAWQAGHEALLQQFRDKEDVYSNFASQIYGFPVNKHEHPLQRHVGKTCVLGLGFQVGWRKLQSSLATNEQNPVILDDAEAQRIVNLYRSVNAPIKAYWQQAEMAIADMYLGNRRSWGPIEVYRNCLVTPNGLALQYPGLRPAEENDRSGWEYHNGKFWKNVYGGAITENATQCLARIVLFGQMLQIDALFRQHGGRVCLSVHDEIIAVGPDYGVPEDENPLFQQMLTIMRTPPSWCADLPLDGEGGTAAEYSK